MMMMMMMMMMMKKKAGTKNTLSMKENNFYTITRQVAQ